MQGLTSGPPPVPPIFCSEKEGRATALVRPRLHSGRAPYLINRAARPPPPKKQKKKTI